MVARELLVPIFRTHRRLFVLDEVLSTKNPMIFIPNNCPGIFNLKIECPIVAAHCPALIAACECKHFRRCSPFHSGTVELVPAISFALCFSLFFCHSG